MDPRCRICANAALTQDIANALRAGSRPVDIYREEAEPRGYSHSSFYRHMKHVRRDDLMLRWVDDRTSLGEALSDTWRLARIVSDEAQRAFSNNKPDLGARLASTASRLKNDAYRAGVTSEDIVHEIQKAESAIRWINDFVDNAPPEHVAAHADWLDGKGKSPKDVAALRRIVADRTNKEKNNAR